MPAGSGELERTARPLLASDIGEIGRIGLGDLVGRLRRRRPQLAAQVRDRLAQVPDGNRLDAAELRLAGRLGRAEDPLQARATCALRDRERTADRPHAPVERELSDSRVLGKPLGGHLPRRRQHRERDREVEARAFLAQTGRREVDRDPLQRPFELRGADAAANPVLRLGARPVGQPDDREARQAAVDVRLDLDPPRLEADEGVGDGAREHSCERYAANQRSKLTIQRQMSIDS